MDDLDADLVGPFAQPLVGAHQGGVELEGEQEHIHVFLAVEDALTQRLAVAPQRFREPAEVVVDVAEVEVALEHVRLEDDREAYRRYGKLIVDLSLRIRRLQQSRDTRSVSGRRRNEDALVRVPYGVE